MRKYINLLLIVLASSGLLFMIHEYVELSVSSAKAEVTGDEVLRGLPANHGQGAQVCDNNCQTHAVDTDRNYQQRSEEEVAARTTCIANPGSCSEGDLRRARGAYQ